MLPNCTAYDLILVQGGQQQQTRRIQCSECMFRFGSHGDNNSINGDNKPNNNGPGGFSVYLLVVTEGGDALRFPIRNHTIQASACSSGGTRQGEPTTGHDASALSTLAASLRPGENTARFILVQNRKPSEAADNNNNNHSGSNGDTPTSDTDGIIVGMAPLNIFSWSIATTKLVVVDVDGTITKSTLLGFWQTAVRKDFSPDSCHDGVCQFLSTLSTQSGPHQQQQYTLSFVYLTNRPITYVEATRGLLTDLRQDSHNLPPGPLLGFTGNLAGVFKVRPAFVSTLLRAFSKVNLRRFTGSWYILSCGHHFTLLSSN